MSETIDNIQPDKIDNITRAKNRISELEAEKAELIEFISTLQEYDFENIVSEQNRLLKKHGVEI